MSQEIPKIFVYFHIANARYSRWIFREVYRQLKQSGLAESATEIHFSVVGKSGFLLPKADNYIQHFNEDLKHGEFVTLKLLSIKAQDYPSARFLYIHTKGVSKFWNRAIRDWRKYMTHFCVDRYEHAVKILDNFDACGVDLSDVPKLHFSGNFWWARGHYLNSLPSIEAISSQNAEYVHSLRHNAEFWIGMGGGSLHSLHNSGINVYQRHLHRFPRSRYSS